MYPYFSTHEVAKMCQVSRGSVIRWIHEGKLAAATTVGGHHRIQAHDLYSLLKTLKMSVPPAVESQVGKDQPACILIVDDEMTILKMLSRFLKRKFQGFSIHEAADGFEAGLLVRDLKPEIILLDLMLPGLDGFQICKRIRRQRELDQTKIIAMTGMPDEKIKATVLAYGADDLLNKPFDLGTLAEKIQKNLPQKRSQHPL